MPGVFGIEQAADSGGCVIRAPKAQAVLSSCPPLERPRPRQIDSEALGRGLRGRKRVGSLASKSTLSRHISNKVCGLLSVGCDELSVFLGLRIGCLATTGLLDPL